MWSFHEDRSRFMVGLAGAPLWTGSLNWYQNHFCSASKDQVWFKTCPGLVSRCLSDPEGVPLGGLNSGASLSVTSSPEVLVLTGAIRALLSAADWLESAIRKWKVLFSQNHKWATIQNPRGSQARSELGRNQDWKYWSRFRNQSSVIRAKMDRTLVLILVLR